MKQGQEQQEDADDINAEGKLLVVLVQLPHRLPLPPSEPHMRMARDALALPLSSLCQGRVQASLPRHHPASTLRSLKSKYIRT